MIMGVMNKLLIEFSENFNRKEMMKTLIFFSVFTIQFVGFGQSSDVEFKLKNTVWRISLIESDFHTIVVFQ